MTTYRIGTPATSILQLTISQGGTMEAHVRRRTAENVWIEAGPARVARGVPHAEFVVRVAKDHFGTVELYPPKRDFVYARTVIPLGNERPYLESELPPSPGSDGSFSISEEVSFRFTGATLVWESENMSGQTVLNEIYPQIAIVLRLPAGNRGAIAFTNPVFTRGDGVHENEISSE